MLHVHLNLGLGDATREFVKLGDGTLLTLLKTWGPVILALFGIKLPPLPFLTADEIERPEPVVGK